jgi:hypothetical protein
MIRMARLLGAAMFEGGEVGNVLRRMLARRAIVSQLKAR